LHDKIQQAAAAALLSKLIQVPLVEMHTANMLQSAEQKQQVPLVDS